MADKIRIERLENLQRNNAKLISELQNKYGANLEGVAQMQVAFFIDWQVEAGIITDDQKIDFNINWEIYFRNKLDAAKTQFDIQIAQMETEQAERLAAAAEKEAAANAARTLPRLHLPPSVKGKLIKP